MMKRQGRLLQGMLSSLFFLVLLVLISGCLARVAYGAEQRVFDGAALFTAAESAQMEDQIQLLRKEMKMDVVIVTTADSEGQDSQSYADDYFDYGGFGEGKQASGVLLLIDMDNREVQISTSGAMIRFLTDERIDAMLDREYGHLASEEYAKAAQVFLDDVKTNYKRGIPGGQYNYDSETGEISRYRSIKWYEAALALAASAICAGGVCWGVIQEYTMKKERRQSTNYLMAYRADADFAIGVQNDLFVDKSVSRTLIPRNTGGSSGGGGGGSSSGRSTTHTSSSGRSHGGGGRKF